MTENLNALRMAMDHAKVLSVDPAHTLKTMDAYIAALESELEVKRVVIEKISEFRNPMAKRIEILLTENNNLESKFAASQTRIDDLLRVNFDLKRAVAHFGRHMESCRRNYDDGQCTCGFHQALAIAIHAEPHE